MIPDAPRETRHLIHQFTSDVVDWRWENLEDAVSDEVRVYADYQKYYKPNTLKRDGALNQDVRAGLNDPFHFIFSVLLYCICEAIGTIC